MSEAITQGLAEGLAVMEEFSQKIKNIESRAVKFQKKIQTLGRASNMKNLNQQAAKVEKSFGALNKKITALSKVKGTAPLKYAQAMVGAGKAFTRAGIDVAVFAKKGLGELREFSGEVRTLGLAMGIESAEKIKKFENGLKAMEEKIGGAVTAMKKVHGVFTEAGKKITEAKKMVKAYKDAKSALSKVNWKNIKSFKDVTKALKTFQTGALKNISVIAGKRAQMIKDTIATRANAAAQAYSTAKTKVNAAAQSLMAVKTRISTAANKMAARAHKLLRIEMIKNLASMARTKAIMIASAVKTKALAAGKLFMAGVTKAVTIAQWLFNAAMTANPIGLVVVAVAALVGGLVLLWKNWDWVTEKLKAAFLWLSEKIAPVFDWISEKVKIFTALLSNMIPDFIKDLFSDSDTEVTVKKDGKDQKKSPEKNKLKERGPAGKIKPNKKREPIGPKAKKNELGPAANLEKPKSQKELKDQKIVINFDNIPPGVQVKSDQPAENISMSRGRMMGAV